jgi:hypothetical protein
VHATCGSSSMNKEIADQLREMAAVLEQQIAIAKRFGLGDTAMLLRMAKLEVELKLHGISEEELRALTEVLEARLAESAGATVIDLKTRTRRKRR